MEGRKDTPAKLSNKTPIEQPTALPAKETQHEGDLGDMVYFGEDLLVMSKKLEEAQKNLEQNTTQIIQLQQDLKIALQAIETHSEDAKNHDLENLKQVETLRVQLDQSQKDQETAERELKNLTVKLSELQKENEMAVQNQQNLITTLTANIVDQSHVLDSLRNEKEIALRRATEATIEIERLSHLLKDAQQQKEGANFIVLKTTAEIEKLKQQLDNAVKTGETIRLAATTMKNKLDQLQTELVHLQNVEVTLRHENDSLKQKVQENTIKTEQLIFHRDISQLAIEGNQKIIREVTEHRDSLLNELLKNTAYIKNLQLERDEARTEGTQAATQLSALKDKLKLSEDKSIGLMQKAQLNYKKLIHPEQDYRRKQDKLEKELIQAQTALEDAREVIQQGKDDNRRYEEKLSKVTDENAKLKVIIKKSGAWASVVKLGTLSVFNQKLAFDEEKSETSNKSYVAPVRLTASRKI